MAFPSDHSRCEKCGYPLRGLSLESTQICPECGHELQASDPAHRVGLPWQHRITPGSFIATFSMVAFHPGKAFVQLRLPPLPEEKRAPQGNTRDEIFLLTCVLFTGLMWSVVHAWRGYVAWAGLWRPTVVVASIAYLLTYIEVVGVVYFSWRQGWRVPFARAERVACYAGVGWLPAGAVGIGLSLARLSGTLDRLWPDVWKNWTLPLSTGLLLLLAGASIMLFETLVWLGIRKTRFGNA
ncbi:MAG: hypothetical protein GC164_02925 [Phycisphaera sp.]|nr:hypothetical protein [Phycisphaera sp.]